jgi:hypothetical protein
VTLHAGEHEFSNLRFQAFSNGLELYGENDEKLLWVRQ